MLVIHVFPVFYFFFLLHNLIFDLYSNKLDFFKKQIYKSPTDGIKEILLEKTLSLFRKKKKKKKSVCIHINICIKLTVSYMEMKILGHLYCLLQLIFTTFSCFLLEGLGEST